MTSNGRSGGTTKKKKMQTKTAVKLPVTSSAKILQRLKDNLSFVRATRLKFRRQKIELFTNTYLYCEQKIVEDTKLSIPDIHRELSSNLGGSAACWKNRYQAGKFIRSHRLDLDSVNPSGLAAASKYAVVGEDAKKLAHLVNTKKGGKSVMAWLREHGYAAMQAIPEWKKKEIRINKKSWKDWELELRRVLDGMAMTTDGNQTLTLSLKVGSKEVLSVTNRR